MAEFRFSLTLLAILVFAPIGRTQPTSAFPTPMTVQVIKIYSLADLGDDPNLSKWIAETIPQMIKPGCWYGQNPCYYAPARVMAIHQTAEVHAQIEEFLANVRKTLPRDKTASRTKHDAHLVPAQFNAEALRPVAPASASQAYPVPPALPTPKHLFHFIIRYEGAGIIDSNVTKFAQAMSKAGAINDNPQVMSVMPMITPGSSFPATYFVPTNGPPRTMPPAEGTRLTPIPLPDEPPQAAPASRSAAPTNLPPPPPTVLPKL